MHTLLKRQIAKFLHDGEMIPDNFRLLLEAINSAYEENDNDRKMLERSLEISSQEMLQSGAEMRTLHDELETRVRDRTAELVRANESLQAEINERKQAEQAREQSEIMFRGLYDLSPDSIVLIDPHDPDASWPIIDCNLAACQMHGYDRDELIGNSIDILNLTSGTKAERSAYMKRLKKEGSLKLELDHRHKDGTVFPVEVSTILIRVGEREIVMGIDRNITERKRAEAEIHLRLAELEAVNHISAALRNLQTMDEMLPIVLNVTLDLVDASAGAIWLYDPVKKELRTAVTRGWGEEAGGPAPIPEKPGEGINGLVFASGMSYISGEFHRDPRLPEVVRQQIPPGIGGAAIPVRAEGAVIGTLNVNVPLPRELRQSEVNLLTILGEIAGNAIHRTRLFRQTEQRLERIAALHAIDKVISSSFDLHFTLDIVLTQVTNQLSVDAADILLLDSQTRLLELGAAHGFSAGAVNRPPSWLDHSQATSIMIEQQIISIPNFAESGDPFVHDKILQAEEFVAYYGVPLISKGQAKGVLEIFHRKPLNPDPEWLDFLNTLAGQAAIAIDNNALVDGLHASNLELTLAYDATIEGWSRALDLRDKETEGHTQRVTGMTLRLARSMGLSDAELIHMRRGALLHDIGKMGVPDVMLLKPDKLTDEEMTIMRKHPTYAYEMLSPIQFLRPALDIPYCHHEKWDGTGYPRGLRGEEIPLVARIFAIVDIWDALRSDRPYRAAWPEEQVRDYIRSLSGGHLDAQVVDAFMSLIGPS